MLPHAHTDKHTHTHCSVSQLQNAANYTQCAVFNNDGNVFLETLQTWSCG